MCNKLSSFVECCDEVISQGQFDKLEPVLRAHDSHSNQCNDCQPHAMFYRAIWLHEARQAHDAAHVLLAVLSESAQVVPALRARAINFHAMSLDLNDQYSEALRVYQQAVDLCDQEGNRLGLARALFNQAVIMNNRLDNSAQAIRLLDRAGSVLQQVDDQEHIVRILNERGIALMHQRCWDEARMVLLDTHTRCVSQDNQYLRAICEINLGNWEHQHEQWAAAENWYQGALPLVRKHWEATAEIVFYLSQVAQQQGQLDRSSRFLARLLRISRRRDSRHFMALAYLGMARLAEHQGDLQRALKRYWQTVRAVEQIRSAQDISDVRLNFQAQWQAMYIEAASCALQHGEIASALLFSEHARSRMLLDTIGGFQVIVDQNIRPDLSHELEKQQRELYTVYIEKIAHQSDPARQDKLEALEQSIADIRSALSLYSQETAPTYAPPSLARIQEVLPPRAAILSYVNTSSGLGVFMIDQDQVLHRSLDVSLKQIQTRLNDVGQVCDLLPKKGTERLSRYLPVLRLLYNGLLAPIVDWLMDYTKIYLVPDLGLRHIPFHLLAPTPDQLCPLLEGERQLRYLPSASLLTRIAPLQIDGSLLAIGNDQPNLKLIEAHAQQVALRAGGRVLLGDTATREVVRQATAEATQIYFACHNQFRSNAPLDSGLLLADGRLLTLRDLHLLRITGCRVVLGACQSGLAAEQGGEWIGLTSALLQAGAAQVLGSLWDVSEVATCLLMDRLWLALTSGDEPLVALRQAQADLCMLTPDDIRHSFSAYDLSPVAQRYLEDQIAALIGASSDTQHPLNHSHYWGAFIVVGA